MILAVPKSLANISDPQWSNVVVALHLNGVNGGTSFPDVSLVGASWGPFTGATTSTVQSKFNGSSLLTGSPAGIATLVAFVSHYFGTSQWSMDGWLYPTSNAATQEIWAHRASGAGSGFWLLRRNVGGALRFIMNNGSNVIDKVSTQTCALNTWTYFRVQRRSITGTLTLELSLGGVYGQSGTDSTVTFPTPAVALTVGSADAGNGAGGWTAGYLADFRMTIGSVRDTGSNFTPPTLPFPNH